MGVNYNIRSTTGKSLVAHHDQLKPYPIPLGQGKPIYPAPETPGVVISEVPQVEQRRQNEAQGIQARDTPRPTHLRQVINPPNRYGDFVVH